MANTDIVARSWVLITGASTGIGEAFAKRFAREGWNTILVARSQEKLQVLNDLLCRDYGVKGIWIAKDLTKPEASHEVYEEVKRRQIALDGLVNNAGCGFSGRFAQVPLEQYLMIVDLNIRALVTLTHLFLPEMLERKRGFILNVSSTACYQPLPFSSVYAASKSFVTSFTEALWQETKGSGVRVLNLCPGVTKTEFGVRAGLRDFRTDPFAEDPERVVDTAFKALKKRAPTTISGFGNRLLVLCERSLPHRLLLQLVWMFQKTRGHV